MNRRSSRDGPTSFDSWHGMTVDEALPRDPGAERGYRGNPGIRPARYPRLPTGRMSPGTRSAAAGVIILPSRSALPPHSWRGGGDRAAH